MTRGIGGVIALIGVFFLYKALVSMRGGALPPGLLAAALGLALAFGPRRLIAPASLLFLVLAAVVAQFKPDPRWSDPIFYGCWGSVILASIAAMA